MCGQLGIIFGTKRRRQEEIDHLTDIFTDLLLQSQKRGPHATGVAWLNRKGEHNLYKQPIHAQEFIEDRRYRRVLLGIDNETTILMGHTRWKTRGDARNNLNNHPIRTRFTLGTHNGTITNADYLFWRYRLPRIAEVDSEVIFRIADSVLHDSRFDIPLLVDRLSLCRGQMSAVMAAKTDPETILVIKGNRPLGIIHHKQLNALLYASDPAYLLPIRKEDKEWTVMKVRSMQMLAFNIGRLHEPERLPVGFTAQESGAAMRKGVSTYEPLG